MSQSASYRIILFLKRYKKGRENDKENILFFLLFFFFYPAALTSTRKHNKSSIITINIFLALSEEDGDYSSDKTEYKNMCVSASRFFWGLF